MSTIVTDFDDVVFPLIDSIHGIAFEEGLHDGSRPAEQWSGWLQYEVEEARYWALWDLFRERNGYEDTVAIPGALEALAEAKDNGHTNRVVTARGFFPDSATYVRRTTEQWVERFAPGVVDSVTFAQDKPAAIRRLGGCDVAFDDSPKHYRAIRDGGYLGYLVDHAHNADFPAPNGHRVPSLEVGLRRTGMIG